MSHVSTDPLKHAVAELHGSMSKARAHQETLLRDIVALDLAAQVYGATKGTISLAESDTPEMAYLPARHAFESTCDLLYLLKAAPNPNYAGARAYVAALFATRENLGLMKTSGDAMGQPWDREIPDICRIVEEDAEAIDTEMPDAGYGDLVRRALKDRKRGGDKHWSGLTRSSMIAKIQRAMKDPLLGKMFNAYWGVLSQRSHPRARLGERVHFTGKDIKIDLDAHYDDPGAIGVAEACAATATVMLRENLHLTEEGSGTGDAS